MGATATATATLLSTRLLLSSLTVLLALAGTTTKLAPFLTFAFTASLRLSVFRAMPSTPRTATIAASLTASFTLSTTASTTTNQITSGTYAALHLAANAKVLV